MPFIPPVNFRAVFNYNTALHLPVLCTITSVYEIARKTFLIALKGYQDQIGQTYTNPADRYFIEKPLADMACTLLWAIGHVALYGLGLYRAQKGEALFQKAQTNPSERISLLQDAAYQYRHKGAIYQLAISLRDGYGIAQNVAKAERLFEVGDRLGHKGCSIALGQLYLTGDIGDKAYCFKMAKALFDKDSTPFARYLSSLAAILDGCVLDVEPLFARIKAFNNRFALNFSTTTDQDDLAVELGKAIQSGVIVSLPAQKAKDFYKCAITHLPNGPQKAESHFQFYRLEPTQRASLERAADLGHVQAIEQLADILRTENEPVGHQKALGLLNTIPDDKKTPETHMLMGLFYLSGFGSETSNPTLAADHFNKAHSKNASVHTIYFVALSEMLKECTEQELAILVKAFSEIDRITRWNTNVSLASAGVWEDLALALGVRLCETLNMGNPLYTSQRSIAVKLLDFTAEHAQPPLAKRAALYKQAELHSLSGMTEDQIECLSRYLDIEPNDIETNMRLYNLYFGSFCLTNNQATLKSAIERLQVAANFGNSLAMHLYGVHLYQKETQGQKAENRGFLQQLSLGSNAPPKENEQMKKGKDYILKAAEKNQPEAIAFCQEKKWNFKGVVESVRRGNASTLSQMTVEDENGTRPPSYNAHHYVVPYRIETY